MKLEARFHGITLKASYHHPRKRLHLIKPEYSDIEQVLEDWGTDYEPPCNAEFLEVIEDLTPLKFTDFTAIGSQKKDFTYRNLVNLETWIIPADEQSAHTIHDLDRIEIKGEAFRFLAVDAQQILNYTRAHDFYEQRIDLNFDISADFLPFSVIDSHFKESNYTTAASCNSWTSQEGARTWYAGTYQRNGYRVAFYEAWKVHPELPAGSSRAEVQLFGKEAQTFAGIYSAAPTPETLTAYLLQKLKSRITFRTPATDSNKSRWPVPSWWTDIVAGAGNYSEHTPVTRKIRDADKVARFVRDYSTKVHRLGKDLAFDGLRQILLQVFPDQEERQRLAA